jgi:hypothetical protein
MVAYDQSQKYKLQSHGSLGESWERYLQYEAEIHFQELSAIKLRHSMQRS